MVSETKYSRHCSAYYFKHLHIVYTIFTFVSKVAQRKYTVLDQEKEIHNLSGALKLFFRELKEPLIPFDNYRDFIEATGSGKNGYWPLAACLCPLMVCSFATVNLYFKSYWGIF